MSFTSNILTSAAVTYVSAGLIVSSKILHNKYKIDTVLDRKEKNCQEILGTGKNPLGENAKLICETAFYNIDTSYRMNMSCENSRTLCTKCQQEDANVVLIKQQNDKLSAYNPFWPTAIFKKIVG